MILFYDKDEKDSNFESFVSDNVFDDVGGGTGVGNWSEDKPYMKWGQRKGGTTLTKTSI